ncbi:MAG: dockerin type I repeat-containing protein [Clostridia bacterium]|nr:dockerin type I repeat-containing protein [Clostridia bacterium]
MKNKILYVFFTVAVLLCCFAFSAFAELNIDKEEIEKLDKIENLYECVSKGDVDENGKIEAKDARIILRTSVGLNTLEKEALLKADLDGNGKISANDARLALRLAVGLDKLPEHDVHEMVIVPATCKTEGLTVRVCMGCMKIYAQVTVPASTDLHIPLWKTTVEPTCVKNGLKQFKCVACNTILDEAEIPATGKHSGEWSYPNGKSCYDPVEKTRTCTVCGTAETNIENPKGSHQYKWITEKKNTCTEDGFQVNKCSHCGAENPNEKNQRVLKALGHEYDSTSILEAATCTETGVKEGICAFCGPVTEEIPAHGHKVSTWETVSYSTCSVAGLKEGTCSACKETVTQETAKLKHDFNEKEIHWTAGIPCEGTGIGYIECKKCNEKQDVQIKKLSCTNENSKGTRVLTAATCTEANISINVCDYCSKDIEGTQKTTGKPLGHDYSESSWTDTKPATCTDAGSRERQCSRCTEIQYETVPATGHIPGEYEEVTPATCKEEGSEVAKCSVCSEVTDTRAIEKLEHTYERIITSDKGSTDENGNYIIKARNVCSACGDESDIEDITRIRIQAIGNFADDFAVTFSNDIDVSVGGTVEFTITGGTEDMHIMIMDPTGNEITPSESNGVYSFKIPASFGDDGTVILQIYKPNN